MHLDIQLSEEDLLAARTLHQRPGTVWQWARYGLYLLVLVALALYFGLETGLVGYLFPPVIAVFAGGLVWIVMTRKVRRVYRQQKSLHVGFEMEIDDEGFRVTSELGHVQVPWSHCLRWKENRHLFLVYYSDVLFQMVPKSAFDDPLHESRFRSFLEQNIGSGV